MKKTLLLALLLLSHNASFAQDIPGNSTTPVDYSGVGAESGPPPTTNDSDTLTKIMQYLYNFGAYAGYNLGNDPTTAVSSQIPDLAAFEKSLVETLFGATPVTTVSTMLQTFIPNDETNNSAYPQINSFSNATYNSQNSNYTMPGDSVSVIKSVDQTQPQAQQDPVSQAVLNLLTTPDDSACPAPKSGSTSASDCQFITHTAVVNAALGALPASASTAFSYNTVQPYLGQLNSNTLLAPLLYTTTPDTTQGNSNNSGWPAATQAQTAENFIRTAIGSINLPALPDDNTYNQYYLKAVPTVADPNSKTPPDPTLANYLADLRTFAAQSSVPISNLYSMLAKRMPQTGSSGAKPSQALNEFEMATRRLYAPSKDATGNPVQDWNTYLNGASPAEVQKEMAMILAEMNYQLYLNRQLQERILLTNSLLLIQALNKNQPSPEIGQAGGEE